MSQTKGNQTKKVVFSAAAIALATVISVVIKLPSLPNGGSITLFSMLFVCLVGYWYGPCTGITAAVAYGILQFITGPYVVHPLQVILDYPLAFGLLGISGFFSNSRNGAGEGVHCRRAWTFRGAHGIGTDLLHGLCGKPGREFKRGLGIYSL